MNGRVDVDALGLNTAEKVCFNAFDGGATIAEISRELGVSEDAVRKAIVMVWEKDAEAMQDARAEARLGNEP